MGRQRRKFNHGTMVDAKGAAATYLADNGHIAPDYVWKEVEQSDGLVGFKTHCPQCGRRTDIIASVHNTNLTYRIEGQAIDEKCGREWMRRGQTVPVKVRQLPPSEPVEVVQVVEEPESNDSARITRRVLRRLNRRLDELPGIDERLALSDVFVKKLAESLGVDHEHLALRMSAAAGHAVNQKY